MFYEWTQGSEKTVELDEHSGRMQRKRQLSGQNQSAHLFMININFLLVLKIVYIHFLLVLKIVYYDIVYILKKMLEFVLLFDCTVNLKEENNGFCDRRRSY